MQLSIHLILLVLLSMWSSAALAEPCDSRALPASLYEKIEKEAYPDAEKLALEEIRKAPGLQEPQLNLAKVYINAALRPQLLIDFEALGIDPGKTGTYELPDADKLKKATSDSFSVDPEYAAKAEAQIDSTIHRWPESRSLLYCQTKIDFYSGDHRKFLKSLHRNAEAFADSEEEAVGFFLGYGEKYFKRGDFKKTADVYDILLKTFPENAPLLSSLGVTYLRRGQSLKAAALFDQAYSRAPEDEIIINNIAEISVWTGNFDKAERFLKTKAEMQPQNTSIYFDIAVNAMHSGAEKSLPYWETYFERNKLFPDAEQWSHVATVLQGAIREGLDEEQQLDLALQFIEELKAPKYAIPMMSYLKEKNPGEAAYSYRMAHAYDRAGMYDLAETALQETRNRSMKQPSRYIDVSSNEILYNLARMAYGQDKYQASLDYLDKMEKGEQETANTGYMYGLAYLGLDRKAEALKAFRACRKSSDSEKLRKLCEEREQSL